MKKREADDERRTVEAEKREVTIKQTRGGKVKRRKEKKQKKLREQREKQTTKRR